MVIFPATQKTEAGELARGYRDNLGNVGFQLFLKERHFQSKSISSLQLFRMSNMCMYSRRSYWLNVQVRNTQGSELCINAIEMVGFFP